MATYQYKPYYAYYGPTRSDPFRAKMPDEEVARNMAWFFDRLKGHFAGTDAVIEHDNSTAASITTSLSEAECDEIMKHHLNSLDLFAHKVSSP